MNFFNISFIILNSYLTSHFILVSCLQNLTANSLSTGIYYFVLFCLIVKIFSEYLF